VTVPIRVYVNDRPLDVPRGATACDAVRRLDSVLADRIIAGTASLTDARGIVLAADAVLAPGAIVRVVGRARRDPAGDGDADADA
jgi:hypothetical protein